MTNILFNNSVQITQKALNQFALSTDLMVSTWRGYCDRRCYTKVKVSTKSRIAPKAPSSRNSLVQNRCNEIFMYQIEGQIVLSTMNHSGCRVFIFSRLKLQTNSLIYQAYRYISQESLMAFATKMPIMMLLPAIFISLKLSVIVLVTVLS